MKKRLIPPSLGFALIAALNLLSVGQAPAQTFTSRGNLYGSEAYFDTPLFLGKTLYASLHGLVFSGNTFYGTTPGDYETHDGGGVYAVNFDGEGHSSTSLHTFTPLPTYAPFINADGAFPYAGLILSGSTLYGTTQRGGHGDGTYGEGTLFAVSTNGTGFTNLHDFSSATYPGDAVYLAGNIPYGTTRAYGGGADSGTLFAINSSGFTNLHSFTPTHTNALGVSTNSDGAYPQAVLVLSGNTLYGTALSGGSSGNGTVFAVNTNGTGFTNLHSFTATHTNTFGVSTNSDGAGPIGGLILLGNTLYGTALSGGSSGYGTVFKVNTDGRGFMNLLNFAAAGWLLSGDTLYGTARMVGGSGSGMVFAVNTNGTGFMNLHSFTATHTNDFGAFTNSDGANPQAGLTLLGHTLYGTAFDGGSSGKGTVFAVNTDGTGFTNLYSFTATYPFYPYLFSDVFFTNRDGAYPQSGLNLSGNALYGTTASGGSLGSGTVFSISFPPQLMITLSGVPASGLILSWPTNVAGFDYTGYRLQSTTNPVSSAFWSTNSPAPVVIAGRNTVTNPISGARQFYRLVQ